MNIVIRKACANEAAIIARIVIQSWQESYCSIFPKEFLDALSFEDKEKSIRDKMKIPGWQEYFIISENGHDIGTVKLRYDIAVKTTRAEIAGFYFLSDHVRKGYGTKILHYLEKHLLLQGYTSAFGWILSSNNVSIAFMEKNGYQYSGEEKTMDIFQTQKLKKYIKDLT